MNHIINLKEMRWLWVLGIVILTICLDIANPALSASLTASDPVAQSPVALPSDNSNPVAPSPIAPSPVIQPIVSPIPLPGDPPPQTPAEAESARERIAKIITSDSVNNKVGVFNLFIIFFVTLGPLKVIPVFAQLTAYADQNLRRRLAFRSTLISTIVILLVALIGQNVLKVWRIHLPALMIAAGFLLFLVALNIIMTQYTPVGRIEEPPQAPSLELAISPLSFPTILPPFGIAIALTIMAAVKQLNLNQFVVLGLLLLIMGLNLICMLAARPILKLLTPVLLRILGFALGVMQLALGIEFILAAIELEALVLQRITAP